MMCTCTGSLKEMKCACTGSLGDEVHMHRCAAEPCNTSVRYILAAQQVNEETSQENKADDNVAMGGKAANELRGEEVASLE